RLFPGPMWPPAFASLPLPSPPPHYITPPLPSPVTQNPTPLAPAHVHGLQETQRTTQREEERRTVVSRPARSVSRNKKQGSRAEPTTAAMGD
uniref:Uncharacterized protein n=1 Tax=Aegilops tauschii subsp. strangulata TaxID=200361 RepID=A0A453NQP3_AEGTS